MWRPWFLFVVLSVGCARSGEDDAPKRDSPVSLDKLADARKNAAAKTSGEAKTPLWLQLSRAEIRMGGETIDFGRPDEAKYTRGGWKTGWGKEGTDGKRSYRTLRSKFGTVFPYLIQKRKRIDLRVRSAKGKQDVSLAVDKRKTESKSVGESWQTLSFPLAKSATGRTRVEVFHSGKAPLIVDWLWFDPVGGTFPGKRLAAGNQLSADGSVSYSFYQEIFPDTRLQFSLNAQGSGKHFVRVENSQEKSWEVFAQEGTVKNRSADIALDKFVGDVVRISFGSDSAGKSAWVAPRLVAKNNGAPSRKMTSKTAKNVIFILLDTTRADAFKTFDKASRGTTPALNRFAKNGRAFLSAYNNGNWTKPSVATILSGVHPETHKALKAASVVPNKIQLLPQHLQKLGFYTAALTSNFVINKKFGFERGWDHFVNYSRGKKGNGLYLYQNASKWLRSRDKSKRFFLWVQSVDPHTTYDVPEKYWSRYFKGSYTGQVGRTFNGADQDAVNSRKMKLSARDKEWVKALYQGEVDYQDDQLAGFLKTIKTEGLLDDTIVIITNDHGEEVLDHGLVGHGWSLYEEILRAPLVIHFPPVFGKGVRDPQVVEHVDLIPTLADVLGIPKMAQAEGISLFPRLQNSIHPRSPDYAYSMSDNGKRSVRLGKYKLVVRDKSHWKGLYDLSKEGEARDLRKTRPLAGRACEIYMGEALASPNKKHRGTGTSDDVGVAAESTDMDPATRAQLEALGYL